VSQARWLAVVVLKMGMDGRGAARPLLVGPSSGPWGAARQWLLGEARGADSGPLSSPASLLHTAAKPMSCMAFQPLAPTSSFPSDSESPGG